MNIKQKISPEFTRYLAAYQERINSFLTTVLPSIEATPKRLHQAMHYATLNSGKRIRPLLVYVTGEALGTNLAVLDVPAAAIELVHCYSLVHDDLPAMDDDDLRRGKPTCHRAFDEATAILVGDALQGLAFEVLSRRSDCISDTTRLEMISLLATAAGSYGMAGGQALDLAATGNCLTIEQLKQVHALKTGALISVAIKFAALASGASDARQLYCLTEFANKIGLCFQIQDDILNYAGSTTKLGKNVGTDIAKQKATFATLKGLENAKQSLYSYFHEAISHLAPYAAQLKNLQLLAEYMIIRDH